MLAVFAIWTLLASGITALLYFLDKRAAAKDQRRIAEKTLLAWSLFGGWPGGWLASRKFRHKTQKWSYRVQFASCVFLNVATTSLFWWWWLNR